MANYATLKAAINAVIKANGKKEITGTVLNETLTAMVNSLGANYQFRGVATPSTNPGTPDQNVFYIAGKAGTYTNFNSIELPDGVSILKWNGSWSSETVFASDGVFDISAYKATGGTLATFADLSAALNGGNNIPSALRKGGMSVKYVQTSDNTYVQYRLMADTWSTVETDWQSENVDEEPEFGSNNLIESGGVFKELYGGSVIQPSEYIQHIVAQTTPSSLGNRYSILFNVKRGEHINVQSSWGDGVFAAIWESRHEALYGDINSLQGQMPYTHDNISYIANIDGVLRIGTKKSDNSAFTPEDINNFLSSLMYEVFIPNDKPIMGNNNLFSYIEDKIDFIDDEIQGKGKYIVNNVSDADIALVNSSWVEVAKPTDAIRLRLIYKVPKGTAFRAQCTLSHGLYAALYSTRSQALINNIDYIENYTNNFTTALISGITTSEGYLTITYKNQNGDNFTPQDYNTFMTNVEVMVKYWSGTEQSDSILGRLNTLEKYQKLIIPAFVQGMYVTGQSLDEHGVGNTSIQYAVVTNSVCLLPYRGVRLKIKFPQSSGLIMLIKFYSGPITDGSYTLFVKDDGEFATPTQYQSYSIAIGYANAQKTDIDTSTTITTEEVESLIKNGDISIVYNNSKSIINDYINAITHPWDGVSLRPTRYEKKYPTLLHISDLHGDAKRYSNALDAAMEIGVDALVNTGDSVHLSMRSGIGFINDIGKESDVTQLITLGNHDVVVTQDGWQNQQILTNVEQYENVISPLATRNSYVLPAPSYYDGAPTYYYKDLPNNIRLITLNLYEQNHAPYNGTLFMGCRISQKQIDWFCETLLSTPSNYGVIISLHQIPSNSVAPSVKLQVNNKDSFWQTQLLTNTTLENITGEPIVRIIDAFISKSVTSFTYTNTLVSSTESINVNADFTNINTGVEFIAYITGHTHTDRIGYIETSENLQLCLCNTCSAALMAVVNITAMCETEDLPRGEGKGSIQDAYNIYCIDRDNKEVRIAKGGSNLTVELTERKWLTLPYTSLIL